MHFVIQTPLERAALAAVASHGVTDLGVDRFYLTYFGVLLIPRPLIKGVFYVASIAHFSTDVGLFWASVVVLSSAIVASMRSSAHGLRCIFLFMCVVHLPMHLYRSLFYARLLGVLAWATTACACFRCIREANTIQLRVLHMRIVLAHIVNEFLFFGFDV